MFVLRAARSRAALGVGAATGGYFAYANRPLGDHKEWEASTGLYSEKDQDSWGMWATRAATITLVTAASKLFLQTLNSLEVERDEHEARFQELIRSRRGGRGLITVANHTSIIDDPVLQAVLVGFDLAVDNAKHRWGVCKKNICFPNAAVSSFCGAGKALPIVVGDGVEQTMFKAVARRLVNGDWIHLYPEAACIQSGRLGRGPAVGAREAEKAEQIGLLKWGVGKLCAHTGFGDSGRLPPIVLSYHHTGMEAIYPQVSGENNALVSQIPSVGHNVTVTFGPEIYFDDLIQAYERRYGPRRLAYVNPETKALELWDGATEAERELHSAITRRIQEYMLDLENKVLAREEEKKKKFLKAPQ